MNRNYQKILLVMILLCSSLLFLKTPGTHDVDVWLGLAHAIDAKGMVEGYAAVPLYHPPGMGLLSFISTKISTSLGLTEVMGIKLLVYFFLFLTLIVIYKVTENYYLVIMSYFLLMINSLGLLFLDICFTPFLILSLFYLKKRNIPLTTIFYCLASLIKVQVIILMPFYALQIVNINSLTELKHLDYKKIILHFVLPFTMIYLSIVLIYGMPYIVSLIDANKDIMLSGLATNVAWIITFFLHFFSPDKFGSLGSTHYQISTITSDNIFTSILKYVFMISYAIIFFKYYRQKEKSFEKVILYATAAFLSYFILNKGVHENHLHIAVILLILLYGENRKYFIDMLMWGILFNVNMIMFYSFDGRGLVGLNPAVDEKGLVSLNPVYYRVVKYLDITLLFSFICVAAYFIFISKYIFKRNYQLP